jgi:hypothetical protein
MRTVSEQRLGPHRSPDHGRHQGRDLAPHCAACGCLATVCTPTVPRSMPSRAKANTRAVSRWTCGESCSHDPPASVPRTSRVALAVPRQASTCDTRFLGRSCGSARDTSGQSSEQRRCFRRCADGTHRRGTLQVGNLGDDLPAATALTLARLGPSRVGVPARLAGLARCAARARPQGRHRVERPGGALGGAQIYPRAANPGYTVSEHQSGLLRLFTPNDQCWWGTPTRRSCPVTLPTACAGHAACCWRLP